jgi:phosphonate transport system substrate-binding protein
MRRLLATLLVLVLLGAACGSDDADEQISDPGADAAFAGPLVIGAIPDQDPEILARNYDLVANYLAAELGIEVRFEPVTEYDAAVTAFRVGDLNLVWFGGLTGVQARLQVEGAEAIAQRDIDETFTSVFIASSDSGIEPLDDVAGLEVVAGRTLTFGSDSSTSGRLMPQSFLSDAGVTLDDLNGEPGFSGSHDATIALVEAGTFEVGALNSQVWKARVEAGEVDLDRVQLIFETPTYYDYHWVARPELGADLQGRIVDALKKLDPADADQAAILEFFGAESFIDTESDNYASIEAVGREIGKIDD